nr:agmatine deiminase [Tanacetum cinerariifolium]
FVVRDGNSDSGKVEHNVAGIDWNFNSWGDSFIGEGSRFSTIYDSRRWKHSCRWDLPYHSRVFAEQKPESTSHKRTNRKRAKIISGSQEDCLVATWIIW